MFARSSCWVSALAGAALLVTSTAADAASEIDALRNRAAGYWQARVDASDAIYDFYLPEERGGPVRDAVRPGRQIGFKSFSIGDLEVSDDTGVVEVEVQLEVVGTQLPSAIAAAIAANRETMRERWRRVDGVWYRDLVRGGFNDMFGGDSAPDPYPDGYPASEPKAGGDDSSGKGGE